MTETSQVPPDESGPLAAIRRAVKSVAPVNSQRRDAALAVRDAIRIGRDATLDIRARAHEAVATSTLDVPYGSWLREHVREGQPEHFSRAFARSSNPIGVEFVLDRSDEDVAEFSADVNRQFWGRVRVSGADPSDTSDTPTPADRLTALIFAETTDRFEPDLALRVADAFWENPNLDIVFWDADVFGHLIGTAAPQFMTEWAPDLMLSANPIGRSFAVRASAYNAVGGLDRSLGSDAFWDLLLRIVRSPSQARRLPRVLQHMDTRIAAVGPRSGDVVNAELERRNWPAAANVGANAVWIDWQLSEWPSVSIVVPSRFAQQLLEALMPSLEATDYPKFDVTIVDNSGEAEHKREFYQRWNPGGQQVSVLWADPDVAFNYSRVNNEAVRTTAGEIVVLLNDDTETVDPGWLAELVGWASRPEIGTVGLQLLDGEGRIQHGGVVMGLFGLAEHLFGRMNPHQNTLIGHTDWIRNSMAVTAACVAIRRELWDQIGGFDERFVLCGSDVVLGLDAHLAGYRNVCSPAVTVHHLESATRGAFNATDDMFTSYWRYQRWITGGDPYFSPSLSLRSHEPKLALSAAPSALAQLGPALGRQFGVFAQSMSVEDNRHFAAMCDLSDADIARVADRHRANSEPRDVRSVVWFLPEFDSPFYGGINTALRMADFLRAEHGVENRFCFITGANERWFRSALRASFPGLADCSIAFCNGFTSADYSAVVDQLGHADCAIATIWHSAYTVAAYPGADRSCYLIQDFEPGFYPNGTLFALAEESYKLGLYGICNSPTMGSMYRNRYGGVGKAFMPAVDTTVFHPSGNTGDTAGDIGNDDRPLRVFLYARPGHWRNCWEIASAAIASIKAKHGDRVHFVSAGSWARPNDLDLGIEQLGMLEYASTGDLYRTCDVGIALTVSEHPSYLPLELNACGVPVIAFDLPAGYWILKDGENSLLARRTVASLAERIERLISDDSLRASLSAGASANVVANHGSWPAAFGDVYAFLCDPEGRADR